MPEAGPSPAPAATPALYWGTQLVLGPPQGGPDGYTCYEIVSISFPSAARRDAHQARVEQVIASVESNSAVYLRCDVPNAGDAGEGGDGADEVPLPSPDEVAEAFINAVDFEPPQPLMQPDYAISGLPAFLEPRGTETVPPVTRSDTPYGMFRANANSSLRVHWGEGAVDAVSGDSGWIDYGSRSGGPWPDGDISFVYRDPGSATVRVIRQWTFDWSFSAGPAGALAFELEGTLGPFPIDEVQAIRVR